MQTFWLLLVAVLLLSAQVWLFRYVGLRHLGYTRYFSRKSASVGEQVELVEVLENRSPLPLPWLRAESRISPWLRFGQGAEMDEHLVSADMYHCSLFFLKGFSRLTRRHPVTLCHRGYFSAASVSLTSGDLFGMSHNSVQMDTGAAIEVYPALLSAQEIPPMCRNFLGNVLVKRFIDPDPFLVSGVRPYRYGDAPRDVNWHATARMNELQVNHRDFTADPSLLVVLNVQLKENQWGNLMPEEQESVEFGVSLAATLCMQAIEQGAQAGFAANTDTQQDEGVCVLLPPMRSRVQADALLSLLARIRLRRVKNFYTFLEELRPPAEADVLVLSPYDSKRIQDAMAMLRRRGHSVALQLLPCEAPTETGRHEKR